jgi:iron complex transport system substrate-binding protein
VTQELCEVCAATHPEIDEAIRQLPTRPRIVSVTARRVPEVRECITELGEALGRTERAKILCSELADSAAALQQRLRGATSRPRVWCVEWLDPLMAAGHWVPDMVAMAGGVDGLLKPGQKSICVSWEDIRRYDPEVILAMPCSLSMERTIKEFPLLKNLPGWPAVSAVRSGRVFAVHGGWFHHPGPRLMRGLELMAAIFHPELGMRPSPRYARALR